MSYKSSPLVNVWKAVVMFSNYKILPYNYGIYIYTQGYMFKTMSGYSTGCILKNPWLGSKNCKMHRPVRCDIALASYWMQSIWIHLIPINVKCITKFNNLCYFCVLLALVLSVPFYERFSDFQNNKKKCYSRCLICKQVLYLSLDRMLLTHSAFSSWYIPAKQTAYGNFLTT